MSNVNPIEQCVMCGESTGRTHENRLVADDGTGPLCRDCHRGMTDTSIGDVGDDGDTGEWDW